MQVLISNPELQTTIFIILFSVLLISTYRWRNDRIGFTNEVTEELKGIAILSIIFGHIGYFLVKQNQFLFPLSTMSGVGVNLFLILSGFGLTISALKNPISIREFYQKRLQKLFIPFWIVLFSLLILDGLFLHKTYTASLWQMIFGWFPKADLYTSIDSPLWYFSFILFYYLAFPVLTFRKLIYFSPLLIYIFSIFLINQKPLFNIDMGVLELYKVHIMAFPSGVAIALIIFCLPFKKMNPYGLKSTVSHFAINFKWLTFIRLVLSSLLIAVICYLALHSGVGAGIDEEQKISIITALAAILLGIIKPFQFNLFKLFGKYSYEIYLIHWPLMYRYDLVYKVLPASIATLTYLLLFIILSYFLQKISLIFLNRLKNKKGE